MVIHVDLDDLGIFGVTPMLRNHQMISEGFPWIIQIDVHILGPAYIRPSTPTFDGS